MAERRHRRSNDESWIQTHWRPMMAWQYFAVCLFDFMLGPIFNGIFYAYTKTTLVPWTPLTLQGGGLYHVSMGAIIGVSSWGRTKEKTEGVVTIPDAPAPASVDDAPAPVIVAPPVVVAPAPPVVSAPVPDVTANVAPVSSTVSSTTPVIPAPPTTVITHQINTPDEDSAT